MICSAHNVSPRIVTSMRSSYELRQILLLLRKSVSVTYGRCMVASIGGVIQRIGSINGKAELCDGVGMASLFEPFSREFEF